MKDFYFQRFSKLFRKQHNKPGNLDGNLEKENIPPDQFIHGEILNTQNLDSKNLLAKESTVDSKKISETYLVDRDFKKDGILQIDPNECVHYEIEALEENCDRQISIHFAARTGSLDLLKILLDLGENINSKDSNGYTAFQIACANGHTELVRFLLEKGAIINDSNKTSSVNDKPKILLIPMNFVEKSVETIKFWFQIKRNESQPGRNESEQQNTGQPGRNDNQQVDNQSIKHESKKQNSEQIHEEINVENRHIEKTNLEVAIENAEKTSETNKPIYTESFPAAELKVNLTETDNKVANANPPVELYDTEKNPSVVPDMDKTVEDCKICQYCIKVSDNKANRPKRNVQFSQKISVIESGQVRETLLLSEAQKKRESIQKKRKSRKHRLKF